MATQRTPTPRERTSLPAGIATAATWDTAAAYAGGAMIGNEARLSGFNVQLAGGVNLMRDPRNGRNFEYGGEDPLLAGLMVGNEIKGIQSNHIISTVKHFAFNNQETNRNFIDARIDDAAARQSDLLAFQIAIETGQPGSVMCSYNRINGDYACENNWLLNQILKSDWSYNGYVMSDWGATHSTVPAANAGLDQQSGWPFDKSPYFKDALGKAVDNGHVSEARFDDMAHRILRSMFANGLFDQPINGDQSATIDYAAHAQVTQGDAEGGIVLLKNTGILPLARSARTILIVGGHADKGVLSGGGSSQVYPVGGLAVPDTYPAHFPGPIVYDPSSPMQGIAARTQARVTYDDGSDPQATARLAKKADVVIVFATRWEAESVDVTTLNLPDNQDAPDRRYRRGQQADRGRARNRRTRGHALAGKGRRGARSLVSRHQRRRSDRACPDRRSQSVGPPAGNLRRLARPVAASETGWGSDHPGRPSACRLRYRRRGRRLQMVRQEGLQAPVSIWLWPELHHLCL